MSAEYQESVLEKSLDSTHASERHLKAIKTAVERSLLWQQLIFWLLLICLLVIPAIALCLLRH